VHRCWAVLHGTAPTALPHSCAAPATPHCLRLHRITNLAAEPVFLDQVLLQYWFHGPLDGSVAGSSDNSSAGSAEVDSVVAQVSAAQFRLTCSDASAEIGACMQARTASVPAANSMGLCLARV
jgi:hypothetical protein